MLEIDVNDNPNCAAGGQFVFSELEPPRRVRSIRTLEDGAETLCDVIGVEEGGRFVPARATKVADSGAGFAFLIHGGAWGIRLRPGRFAAGPWDLADKRQWGEAFKLYGEEDIVYED